MIKPIRSSYASTAGASGCWSVYGIFPGCSRRTADSRYRTRCRSRYLGAINLLEGYGNDNPGAKSQGMKQLMAGGGVALRGDLRGARADDLHQR